MEMANLSKSKANPNNFPLQLDELNFYESDGSVFVFTSVCLLWNFPTPHTTESTAPHHQVEMKIEMEMGIFLLSLYVQVECSERKQAANKTLCHQSNLASISCFLLSTVFHFHFRFSSRLDCVSDSRGNLILKFLEVANPLTHPSLLPQDSEI